MTGTHGRINTYGPVCCVKCDTLRKMCVEVKRHSEPLCVCVWKPSCKKTPIESHVQVPKQAYITEFKQHERFNMHTHASCGYPLRKLIA